MKPIFRTIICCTIICYSGLLGPALEAGAQEVSLSGSLDLAYGRDILQDEGEAASAVNEFIKGGSPFSLARSRFFIDSQLADRIAVFTTTLFDEGMAHFDLEGAYLVFADVRPDNGLNLLVGKQAAAFGSFAARSFATVNPLIGTPLMYHYFTAVQGDRVPADTAQQLAWRERLRGSGGVYTNRGQPIVYDSCWNTGAQAFGGWHGLSYAVAVVTGALSNPAAASNSGFQFTGRLGVEPAMGLRLGLSAGYGPYLEEKAAASAGFPVGKGAEDFNQTIVGVDLEYALGTFEFFAEAVRNQWQVPNLGGDDLGLYAGYVEGRYTFRPGLYGAVRYGRIDFDAIADSQGGEADWDYDIQRLEVGLGYYLRYDLRAKAVLQFNFRQGPPADKEDHLLGLQLASTF